MVPCALVREGSSTVSPLYPCNQPGIWLPCVNSTPRRLSMNLLRCVTSLTCKWHHPAALCSSAPDASARPRGAAAAGVANAGRAPPRCGRCALVAAALVGGSCPVLLPLWSLWGLFPPYASLALVIVLAAVAAKNSGRLGTHLPSNITSSITLQCLVLEGMPCSCFGTGTCDGWLYDSWLQAEEGRGISLAAMLPAGQKLWRTLLSPLPLT